MPTVSPAFKINSHVASSSTSVAASGSIVATLDSIAGVNSVAWSVIGTDGSVAPGSYTLTPSGSIGQTVSTTAGAAGTAGVLKCTVNGGINSKGQSDPSLSTTAKWYVPTTLGAKEVCCTGENNEADSTYGHTIILNDAIRSGATAGTATSTATANTIPLRDGVAGFANGYISLGSSPYASAGLIRLQSSASMVARNNANSADVDIIAKNSADNITIGEDTDAANIHLRVKTGGLHQFYENNVKIAEHGATYLSVGTNPAAAGAIRLPNATKLATRNAANDADVDLIQSNSSNIVIVGEDTDAAGIEYRVKTGTLHKLYINNTQVAEVGSAYVSVGTTPATSAGNLRVPNNTTVIAARNAANSGDISLLLTTAADEAVFGHSTQVATLYCDSNNNIHFRPNGTTKIQCNTTGVAFNGASPAARPDYTITNPTTNRSIDVASITLGNLAQVVGTMIQDMINYGLYQ